MKYTKDFELAKIWQSNEGGVIRQSDEYQAYYLSCL